MLRKLVVAAATVTVLSASAVMPAVAASSTVQVTAGSDASVTSMACASAGNCAAGGYFFDDKTRTHAFVMTEINGTWGRAIEVPGLTALKPRYANITAMSCAPKGGCAAGGGYVTGASHVQAFVVTEQNGHWGQVVKVFRTTAQSTTGVNSLSCTGTGNCGAGGGWPPFVASEVNGHWRRATQLPAKNKFSSVVTSCASTGNCSAGWWQSVASERNGHWGKPAPVPGLSALGAGRGSISSMSCSSAADCSVGGIYFLKSGASEAFVASERDGHWGKAIEVPGFTALNQEGFGQLVSVSCFSAGGCIAGGSYAAQSDFAGGSYQAFVAIERNGHWGKAFEVPGIPPPSSAICEPDSNACVAGQVLSVSCALSGPCGIGGWFSTRAIDGQVAFVASYSGGHWTKARQILGLASLDTAKTSEVKSISCTPDGGCAAGGSYSTTKPGIGPAFVVEGKNGTWGQVQTVRF